MGIVTIPVAHDKMVIVTVGEQGHVEWNGRIIGRVYKGTRTYSPPLYKGSRVAKYHKQVPCWYADEPGSLGRSYSTDTRQRAILHLIAVRDRA